MRGVRLNIVVLASVAAAACGGGSPAAPSERPASNGLPFIETSYALAFRGEFPPCGTGSSGASVSVRVTLRRDGEGWAAANENATLTLHFEPQGPPPGPGGPFAIAITGDARGFADDEGVVADPRFSVTPNGTRVTLPDAATLSGAMIDSRVSDLSQGRIDAPVAFSGDGRSAAQCPAGAVTWTLNRML